MTGSMLLYIVNQENEIPAQLIPNTAYYILNLQEIRLIGANGNINVFKNFVDSPKEENNFEARLSSCEKRVDKIYNYLINFKEE